MSTHKTLVQALAKAQSEMDHANLDETNPQFKSKFASLKSVIDAVKPALNNNGIWFLQKSLPIDNGIAIETVFYGYGISAAQDDDGNQAEKETPAKVDFKDLETPIEDLGEAIGDLKKTKKSAKKKPLIDDDPKDIDQARIAVDSLIDVMRAMCSNADEAKDMFKGNETLVVNLENNFPEERQRLRNAIQVFLKQLGEGK